MGILFKHSRPGHPQTCGKIERFHQTIKLFLAKQPPTATLADLQAQIDRFASYYNQIRPHRALNRMTPQAAYQARDKARRASASASSGAKGHGSVRTGSTTMASSPSAMPDASTTSEWVATTGERGVIMLITGLEIRILTRQGELLRQLQLDPTKDYQGTGLPPGPPKGRPLGARNKTATTMP